MLNFNINYTGATRLARSGGVARGHTPHSARTTTFDQAVGREKPSPQQHQDHHSQPAEAGSSPRASDRAFSMECRMGSALVADLFDDAYCANLAFIPKLVEERSPSASQQVAHAKSVWQDPALALRDCFVSLLVNTFECECQGIEGIAGSVQLGTLTSEEKHVVQTILRNSRKSEKALLEFIPIPRCVHGMMALLMDPLLDCRQQLEGGGRVADLLASPALACQQRGYNLPLEMIVCGFTDEDVLMLNLDQNQSHLVSLILQVLHTNSQSN
ncbi:unnamed protein product [Symbiodinium sp. CCMP2592]|nr:unnamed protein product [Symbiodinium sp. CCMP2592]